MKVRVTAKLAWDGFALRRRREGEVFDFPDKHIRIDKDTKKPVLPRWCVPVNAKAPAKAAPQEEQAGGEGAGSDTPSDVI